MEFLKLNQCVNYEQPQKYIVKNTNYSLNKDGIPVLTPGKTFILGYTNESDGIYYASNNNPIILFDDFTCSFHWVNFPFKVKSSALKILYLNNKNVNFRYIYHWMVKLNIINNNHTRQWISKYSEIQIPIPPLDIQNKIVEILDNFSNYEAELEAEQEYRNKQYKYYRDSLFSNLKDVEYLPLWTVTNWNKKFNSVEKTKQKVTTKFKGVSAKQLKELAINGGDIKLLATGLFDGYTNKETAKGFINEGEIITLPEGGNANIKYWNGKFVNSLNLIATSSNNDLYNLKYIYYYLKSRNNWIEDQYRGSNVKHPNMSKILELETPIPPLDIQNKIVEILDNFSSLVNDIKDGLPKEIELRKKQYNYYLNRLLDFKVEK